jgi:hydroxymethylpyrimidine/phosphomethylpyrimidine kinase
MRHRVIRPSVLVFAGLDPSGGAGIAADILAIQAQGAHALTIVTTLTVQDNDRVFDVFAVSSETLRRQGEALLDKMSIDAVKIGLPGSLANAQAIAQLITALRLRDPSIPVVLDPVLASGHGDALSRGDALLALAPLLPLVTLVTPNLAEAQALSGSEQSSGLEHDLRHQARRLHELGCRHVLITGGHGVGDEVNNDVINRWFGPDESVDRDWRWPRLAGEFHGSGCTLAAALAARLALGEAMELALESAQAYCHQALAQSYAIAPGQRIPLR